VEGGSANDYVYCSGDPINCNDLDGNRDRKQNVEWFASVGWYCARTFSLGKCNRAWGLGQLAETAALQAFPGDHQLSQRDAFKHVYWHALMVSCGLGFKWSQGLGLAYELYSNNRDGPGDLVNNRFGAEIGQRVKDGTLGGSLYGYVKEFVDMGYANTTTNCASCLRP
jgi:hypothetical protein